MRVVAQAGASFAAPPAPREHAPQREHLRHHARTRRWPLTVERRPLTLPRLFFSPFVLLNAKRKSAIARWCIRCLPVPFLLNVFLLACARVCFSLGEWRALFPQSSHPLPPSATCICWGTVSLPAPCISTRTTRHIRPASWLRAESCFLPHPSHLLTFQNETHPNKPYMEPSVTRPEIVSPD
jgi:hypothetical protein